MFYRRSRSKNVDGERQYSDFANPPFPPRDRPPYNSGLPFSSKDGQPYNSNPPLSPRDRPPYNSNPSFTARDRPPYTITHLSDQETDHRITTCVINHERITKLNRVQMVLCICSQIEIEQQRVSTETRPSKLTA